MAGSRSDKTTIARDPLGNLDFRQPSPPINGLIADTSNEKEPPAKVAKPPEPRGRKAPAPLPEPEAPKGKVTVVLPLDLIERLRNAVYWKRMTLAALAENGIEQVVAGLEKENGGPFEARENELKAGRPLGSRGPAARGH